MSLQERPLLPISSTSKHTGKLRFRSTPDSVVVLIVRRRGREDLYRLTTWQVSFIFLRCSPFFLRKRYALEEDDWRLES